jgi:LysM repeat protein
MISRKTIGFITLVLLVISLAACERSASTVQTVQATPTIDGFPVAVESTPGMGLIEQLATQTAMAQTAAPLIGESTPAPAQSTPDPFAALNQTPLAVGGSTQEPATAMPSPTPQTVSQPTVQIQRPGSYTLQKGEFPYCIARRFNVNPQELLSLNGLNDGQILQVGLVLKIPQTGNAFPADRALRKHPAQYTVVSQDTIYSIACLFGDVDPLNIAAVNNLSAPYTLTVGQTIQIP